MNHRLKEIRTRLNLSQEEFGSRIGIKSRAHISSLESGSRNITDRIIKDLVSVYNVNEEWLRTGEGDMFNESDTFSLDDYAKQKKLTELEFNILKTYMELDPDVRKAILSTFKNTLSLDMENREKVEEKIDNMVELIETEPKSGKDEPSKDSANITSSNEPTTEELEEEYKKRRSKSVSETDTPASNGTGGDRNKVI